MYNHYPNDTEAWWATKDAIGVCDTLKDSADNIEAAFEEIIGQLDTAISDAEEHEAEAERLDKELTEIKEKYEALHEATDIKVTISFLTNIKVAINAMDSYLTLKLTELGALNASDTDSNTGDSSDAGPENADSEGAGEASSEGVTRPQVP